MLLTWTAIIVLALYLGFTACEGELVADGSARSDYCDVFRDTEGRGVVAGAGLLYGPAAIAFAGALAALILNSRRVLRGAALFVGIWLLALTAPLFLT